MGELIFIRPTGGTISSVFGKEREKEDKVTKKKTPYKHGGVDYAAPKGTSVRSSESGKVIYAETDIPGFGKLIIIDHTPKAEESQPHIYTLYAHLNSISVRKGDYVLQNVTIGGVGHTGRSTHKPGNKPDHLHFEVFKTERIATVGDMIQKGGAARKFRVDPTGIIGRPITVGGTLTDVVEQAIIDRMELVPDIDLARKYPVRMQVWLDGKNLGEKISEAS